VYADGKLRFFTLNFFFLGPRPHYSEILGPGLDVQSEFCKTVSFMIKKLGHIYGIMIILSAENNIKLYYLSLLHYQLFTRFYAKTKS